jgi:hypothetical protein
MMQEMLAPQPIALTRSGRQWTIEGSGEKMTAEEQGRTVADVPPRAERRRQERQQKRPKDDLIAAGKA